MIQSIRFKDCEIQQPPKKGPAMTNNLDEGDLTRLKRFIANTIAERRDDPSRGDIVGVPSGTIFNLLKLSEPDLARRIRARQDLIRYAEALGFVVRPYRGGRGKRGSGIWETIDLPK